MDAAKFYNTELFCALVAKIDPNAWESLCVNEFSIVYEQGRYSFAFEGIPGADIFTPTQPARQWFDTLRDAASFMRIDFATDARAIAWHCSRIKTTFGARTCITEASFTLTSEMFSPCQRTGSPLHSSTLAAPLLLPLPPL